MQRDLCFGATKIDDQEQRECGRFPTPFASSRLGMSHFATSSMSFECEHTNCTHMPSHTLIIILHLFLLSPHIFLLHLNNLVAASQPNKFTVSKSAMETNRKWDTELRMRMKKAQEHAKDLGTPRQSCNMHRGGKPPPYLSCPSSVISKMDFRLKRPRAL